MLDIQVRSRVVAVRLRRAVAGFAVVATSLALVACSSADHHDAIDQTGNGEQDLSARGFDDDGVESLAREDEESRTTMRAPDYTPSPEEAATFTVESSAALSCSHLQWWNSYITYSHMSYGWHDTDLSVHSSTAVELRHASRLVKHGVYGWGYMPEFVDLVTGKRFRFLHLRPQHQLATVNGRVYPAGYVVGYSGGDTHDTGYPTYSTGAHLCVQSLAMYRACFPAGHDACR